MADHDDFVRPKGAVLSESDRRFYRAMFGAATLGLVISLSVLASLISTTG